MDFNALLSQVEMSRPDLADSLSMLREFQKNNSNNETSVIDITPNETDELSKLLDKQKKINKNLFDKYQQLETNYGLLVEQMDQFAEAIGACPECWGEERQCNHCRGRGKPGYFHPKQEYFDMYIKPVIFRINRNKP